MKRLLNTLYVTTEGAYLRRDGETVAVEIDGVVRARMPCHLLAQIVLFGETTMSRDMMAFAAQSGISVAWLTYSGKLAARVRGTAIRQCAAAPRATPRYGRSGRSPWP